ncbi:DegT/DnrJ/EryC1/StrS family aminotransferase [Micromonospora sp. NPDC049282]|uniref:DegT/DnrJ/EryC1/StrS family aminotransferase n=1 Tax=Micromonospora sp. NPDC049282 TaxID=3364269 RepID=UPI00371073DB
MSPETPEAAPSAHGPEAWPPIDEQVRAAVLRQLDQSVSIYDRSGVIKDFEERFRSLPGSRYALLTSSGTAALHSAYYALGIGPGDEVLCPAYTFFATALPLFQLGAVPVLVDSTVAGLLDLDLAERLLAPRTRAMVITHMWGYPQPVRLYREFCDLHGIALVEDCSHAHGASAAGQPVGGLADVAAWSLQGNKTVSAGEGGVLCTDEQEIYVRANLLGHFNRRSINEIPRDHPLHRYADTGLGLKYRAHPLGVAMAAVYLDRLPRWLAARQRHVEQFLEALGSVDAISPLLPPSPEVRCSYYALPLVVHRPPDDVRRLLAHVREAGYPELTDAGTFGSLSNWHLFQHPRSPVTDQPGVSLRRPVPVAEHLQSAVVRVPVPVGEDPGTAERFRSLGVCLADTLAELDMVDTVPARHPVAVSVSAAVAGAAADRVERLVVGAVIPRAAGGGTEVLLAKRRPDDFMGGFEEIVGGEVEPGEGLLDALCREILEETGLRVRAISETFAIFDYVDSGGRSARQFNFTVDVDPAAVPVLSPEHVSLRWVGRDAAAASQCSSDVKQVLHRWFAYHEVGLAAPRLVL